ncbi:hypothetical protein KUF83_38485 [Streptomyces sp. BV286]|nr:hypothetical protein [Streptomyces sp. BV286]
MAWVASICTSIETVIEFMPLMMLSGTLTQVLDPLNVSPSPLPDQLAVPLTVPLRPLPEASTATVPEVASSLYQRARPSVISAAWAGATGPARPMRSEATATAARAPGRNLRRP